jgi:hypothetical protein
VISEESLDITITKASVDGKPKTLTEGFTAYLAIAIGPADVGILVRSFELSLRATKKSPWNI